MNAKWQKRILAYNLKFLRGNADLTQQEVAIRAHLSPRAYQSLESGLGNPTLETVALLAHTFKVSPSALFHLTSIRLSLDFNVFLEKYQDTFQNDPHCVGLRTVNGIVVWANGLTSNALGSEIVLPYDLLNSLPPNSDVHGLLSVQLQCEQQGIAQPYLVPTAPFKDGGRDFYRVIPTLIYAPKGKSPSWTSTLAVKVINDLSPNYFSYYNRLLECCFTEVDALKTPA